MNLTEIKREDEDCILLLQENKLSYPLNCWDFFWLASEQETCQRVGYLENIFVLR